jgi:hypothetical protein
MNVNETAAQCTRVYMLTGRSAHLLPPGVSTYDAAATALCGVTNWPAHFRGTGAMGEREQAADMPLCRNCERLRNQRWGQ